GDDFPRGFGSGLPPATRLGALYQETARLGGGPLDRRVANESWAVARVLLAGSISAAEPVRQRALDQAGRRLGAWSRSLTTLGGRADAGASAAEIELHRWEYAAALRLADGVLQWAGEGEAAVRCRRVRHLVLERELELAGHATQLPARKALHVRA